MKTLLLLRHAKSSWSSPDLPDHDRPLNDRGRRDATRIGELLKVEDLVPDLILSSTAKRARKTAKKVAAACGYRGAVQELSELYLAEANAYFTVMQELDENVQRVLIVGHNPGIEHLLSILTRATDSMSTAALAHISITADNWQEVEDGVTAKFENFWRPRELP